MTFTHNSTGAPVFPYKRLTWAVGAALMASGAIAAPSMAAEPPAIGHEVISFPSRDFVSAAGYVQGVPARVQVRRRDASGALRVVSQSTAVMPQDDPSTPEFDGLVEVNHPGGGCWLSDTQTPNIRPGDVVRVTDKSTGVAEETTVANVTVNKPSSPSAGTVVVTGTALRADRTAIPLAQVEQRFVNAARFDNGSRTLRAPGRGTLTEGPTVGSWVATYTGLSAADVADALGGETRAMWLGASPAAGTELTIYELPDALSDVLNGVMDGPSAPCTAPAEVG
jgi:hypothetical protein